jgi:DNA/RNA endonuclease YhcR with UshA esterase domain
VILRLLIYISFALFVYGCKGDKQPEYIDEKLPPVPEQQKQEEKKQDSASNTQEKNNKTDVEADKFAYKRSEEPVAVISPLEANNYMGKYVTVKGFVADVHKSEKVAYLNFIEKFPENPFTAVVFANKFEEFGDLSVYEGKNVEASGRVSTFRGKPQMILDKKSQIKIVN